jgi:hypothetical protein
MGLKPQRIQRSGGLIIDPNPQKTYFAWGCFAKFAGDSAMDVCSTIIYQCVA